MMKVGLTTTHDKYTHLSTTIEAAFELICMYLVSSMAFCEERSTQVIF